MYCHPFSGRVGGENKKQNISRPELCARVYCQAAVGLCFLVRTILTGEQIYFELTKVSYCSRLCPFHFPNFKLLEKTALIKKNSFYFFQDGRGDVSYYVAQAVLKLLRSKGSSCLSLVSSWGFRCVTVDPVVSLAFVLWSWVVTISSRMSHIVILGCPLSHPERPTW